MRPPGHGEGPTPTPQRLEPYPGFSQGTRRRGTEQRFYRLGQLSEPLLRPSQLGLQCAEVATSLAAAANQGLDAPLQHVKCRESSLPH